MQPWKVSVGLTTSITGAAVLLGGSRLRYLAPFWRVILDDYGLSVAVHPGVGSGDGGGHPLWCRTRRRTRRSGTKSQPCGTLGPARGG